MKKKYVSLFLAAAMTVSMLAGCGSGSSASQAAPAESAAASTAEAAAESTPAEAASTAEAAAESTPAEAAPEADPDADLYGPKYDDWSAMTDEELYEQAKAEGEDPIVVYATSSKMLKVVEDFQEAYPGLTLEVSDLDNDEVLQKAKIEAENNNVVADVLQVKDSSGDVFYDYYEDGYIEPFYPQDISEKIDPDTLKYGYPLYASQSMWYYNTEIFPDGQPVTSWWNFIEKNEDGSYKYKIFTKEIGKETTYLALFAEFINHADEMAQAYKDLYGTDLEYTYDSSVFTQFQVPENNAGVEYLWRFSQMVQDGNVTFIGDGDELVQAVNNSDAEQPSLALASAGKISNRDESGYNIAWITNITPFTGLQNLEYMYLVSGTNKPAGARLFIRWITGGADGASGGLKAFMKEGNWPVRNDVTNDKNPVATVTECGAIAPNISAIYENFYDVLDMWTKWATE